MDWYPGFVVDQVLVEVSETRDGRKVLAGVNGAFVHAGNSLHLDAGSLTYSTQFAPNIVHIGWNWYNSVHDGPVATGAEAIDWAGLDPVVARWYSPAGAPGCMVNFWIVEVVQFYYFDGSAWVPGWTGEYGYPRYFNVAYPSVNAPPHEQHVPSLAGSVGTQPPPGCTVGACRRPLAGGGACGCCSGVAVGTQTDRALYVQQPVCVVKPDPDDTQVPIGIDLIYDSGMGWRCSAHAGAGTSYYGTTMKGDKTAYTAAVDLGDMYARLFRSESGPNGPFTPEPSEGGEPVARPCHRSICVCGRGAAG